MFEKLSSDFQWPLQGSQPRIIRLRRDVTELEQRLASLERLVKEEDHLQEVAVEWSLRQELEQPKRSPRKSKSITIDGLENKSRANGDQSNPKATKQDKNNNVNNSQIDDEITTKQNECNDTSDRKQSTSRRKRRKNNQKTKCSKDKHNTSVMIYKIDCSQPSMDSILNAAHFKSYISERIKVDGKVSNFGGKVSIELAGTHELDIVCVDYTFPKRYLKFLTKKYLKKEGLKDMLRVIRASDNDNTLVLRYYKHLCNEDSDSE